jgi:diguanylate cyclase (GGDEF)-like protein
MGNIVKVPFMAEKPSYADLEKRVQELEDYQKRESVINILSLLNKIDDLHDLITEVALLLRNWSGCEAVGIRMKENGDYPYFQTLGFSRHHIRLENCLCAYDLDGDAAREAFSGEPSLKGMCGKVLRGQVNSRLSCFTEYGSFITNSASAFRAADSRELREYRICSACGDEGYESLALIPLKNSVETFGLIQLNDSRKHVFSSQLIALLEKLAFNLSIGLGKKRAAQQLRKTKEELSAIYENAPISMLVVNSDLRVTKHNTFTNTFFSHGDLDLRGRSLAEVVCCPLYANFGQSCCLNNGVERCRLIETVENTFQNEKDYNNIEARLKVYRYGKIEEFIFLVSSTLLRQSVESQVLITMMDITQRKLFEEKLNEMSFYDSLTGLYNRNFFNEEMRRFQDGRYLPIGIILCDLDGFKFINDTLGHQAGDELLSTMGMLLHESFRCSDIVSRIGGDEFAILVPSADEEKVEKLVQRLRNTVQKYNDNDPRIPISLSIGYSVGEDKPVDMEKLFREADDMMYGEKMQREESTRSSTVKSLMRALEARDFISQGHGDRLQELVQSMAASLDLSEKMVNDLALLVRFHDLGKIGIPDHILFKQGRLTERERQEVRKHSEIGQRIARAIPGLDPIAQWILQHHERWDGTGYPQGLQGEKIPLACRILAIADAYDAMTSDRPYRKAMTREEAIAELKRCAGTQFDPELVDRFVAIVGQCESV